MIYIYIDWVNNWISQAKKIPCFLSILLQKVGLGSLTKDTLRGFFPDRFHQDLLTKQFFVCQKKGLAMESWFPMKIASGSKFHLEFLLEKKHVDVLEICLRFVRELYHSSTKVRIVRGIKGAVIMWEDNDSSIVFELSESGFKLLDGNTDNDF